MPVNKNEIACIGGPIESINTMTNNVGASSAVRYLSNFISNIAAGYAPKIDFFPKRALNMDEKAGSFADQDIHKVKEFLINQIADSDLQGDEDAPSGSTDVDVLCTGGSSTVDEK